MGMKSKVTGGSTSGLSAGIHSVTIKDFKGYKNDKGVYITNRSGAKGFIVTFSDGKNILTDILWYSEITLWKLRKLFRAIQMNDDVVSYDDIIGKELWLHVAQEYLNNDRRTNPERFELVTFEYSIMTESRSKPAVMGDPAKGEIGGDFIIERHQELSAIPMPKPIQGDALEFMQKGITPNVDFREQKIEEVVVELEDEEEGF